MMARTSADRQSAYRARLALARTAEWAEAERLRNLAAALEARLAAAGRENEVLRREVAALSAALESESGAGNAPPGCQHPSGAVADGRCTACGEWL